MSDLDWMPVGSDFCFKLSFCLKPQSPARILWEYSGSPPLLADFRGKRLNWKGVCEAPFCGVPGSCYLLEHCLVLRLWVGFPGPPWENVDVQMGVIFGRSGAGSLNQWLKGIVMRLASGVLFSAFQSRGLEFYLRVENLSILK